jgi:hypothetical protein
MPSAHRVMPALRTVAARAISATALTAVAGFLWAVG